MSKEEKKDLKLKERCIFVKRKSSNTGFRIPTNYYYFFFFSDLTAAIQRHLLFKIKT